ncbi:DUF4956 domain-containing protein [Sediminitomix flava]|uniref:Uncharacterized protein DUF4956 n=1 Tax=Sediminitomix flava TaxID=379075 RepID=A0A315ZK42_SEDFL|nr:DUF4956 domain-containing protein [Sediminitomix flava]PWJ45064.1 uncharacterized protein DUF4956 [Sediminitomix flava]
MDLNFITEQLNTQTSSVSVFQIGVFLIRMLINLLSITALVRVLYARNNRNRDFFFTYYGIGFTVFLICYMLQNVELELGFALGLFAVFGIIRYRTDPIPIKSMTYLFVVIGISIINALAGNHISEYYLFLVNSIMILGLWAVESSLFLNKEQGLLIFYEKIENIKPENSNQLLHDLFERTGLLITRYEIKDVDFLRDAAHIQVFYLREDASQKEVERVNDRKSALKVVFRNPV